VNDWPRIAPLAIVVGKTVLCIVAIMVGVALVFQSF